METTRYISIVLLNWLHSLVSGDVLFYVLFFIASGFWPLASGSSTAFRRLRVKPAMRPKSQKHDLIEIRNNII